MSDDLSNLAIVESSLTHCFKVALAHRSTILQHSLREHQRSGHTRSFPLPLAAFENLLQRKPRKLADQAMRRKAIITMILLRNKQRNLLANPGAESAMAQRAT